MTQSVPDAEIRVPLLRQAWCMVTFVHWRYDASVLQPMLPPGLTVDQRDGSAWATLAARWLLGAPYVRADLAVGVGDGVRYLGTRAGSWGYQLDVQPGLPLSPSDLDIWLTPRWRAYCTTPTGSPAWRSALRARWRARSS